jgi:putative inorganic carbon (hco3(-)) transporter
MPPALSGLPRFPAAVPLIGQSSPMAKDESARALRIAFGLAWGSSVSIVFSIALSQTLLVLALVAILVAGKPLRFPPVKLPLACFIVLTVISVIASPDPYGGLPQIRKFLVFATILVVFQAFESVEQIRDLVLAWTGLGCLSAAASFFQLWHRHRLALEQNANDYGFYLDGRLTGLASHWMTFGAEQMIALLMALSLVLYSRRSKTTLCEALALPVLWVSLVLGLTRSIFLVAVPVGVAYLVWQRKRRIVIIPALLLAGVSLAAPFHVRDRIVSVFRPHREVDSNLRRIIMIRTGLEMVKAHPWLGVGPEQVGRQFNRYVPSDITKPLPKGWYGHLHNVYLQYAAERGLPALGAMLWFLVKLLRDFRRALRQGAVAREAAFVVHGAVATLLAITAEGLFEHNLGDSEVLTMFLVVISCAYVVLMKMPGATERGAP